MDTTSERAPMPAKDDATVERTSDRDLVASRTINGPARVVYEAWTDAELFRQWWVPRSFPAHLRSCELDVRVGGGYRLVFGFEDQEAAFFGRYLEVVPGERLVWTNDEDPSETVTTVTFEEADGRTRVTVHDRYGSKEALDEAIGTGSASLSAMPESLAQLDELLAARAA